MTAELSNTSDALKPDSSIQTTRSDSISGPSRFLRLVAAHPLTVFFVLVFGVGWPVLTVPLLADRGLIRAGPLPAELFALAVTWLVMLPAALGVTAVSEGGDAARHLLRRLLHWRLGLGWWLTVLLALPVTTMLVGLALGGSVGTGSPSALLRGALFLTTAFLLIHLWEESVWAGFVQTRLERKHGVLVAALLTAVPFASIHVPILLIGSPAVLPALGGVLALGVGMRLLVGVFLRGTSGSLLVAGLVHAVYNACNNRGGLLDTLLAGVDQNLAAPIALVLVTAAVALVLRRRVGPTGRVVLEQPAAAGMLRQPFVGCRSVRCGRGAHHKLGRQLHLTAVRLSPVDHRRQHRGCGAAHLGEWLADRCERWGIPPRDR